jgi:hypothetical protein
VNEINGNSQFMPISEFVLVMRQVFELVGCLALYKVYNFFSQAAGNMFHSVKQSTTIAGRPTCSYLAHECSGQRVEGYDYCIRHILEDKTAPYRLCGYVYSGNGRRCIMPTPKGDKRESGYIL